MQWQQLKRLTQLPSPHCMQATKGNQTMTFYTMPEYESWKENTNTRGWSIKYYKGLGTSTAKASSLEEESKRRERGTLPGTCRQPCWLGR